MFQRLYFDSDVLIAAGWPRLSADLENLLEVSAASGIAVLLPAAVEVELERRWQRELDEKANAVRSKVQAVEAHFRGIGTSEIIINLPDGVKALDNYIAIVNKLKAKYRLTTVKFTERPVADIFRMAADRHPPFKPGKDDVGFRDAVIFLSVLDDLMGTKNQVGALVSRDDVFHDSRIITFAAAAGVTLRVFRSVE